MTNDRCKVYEGEVFIFIIIIFAFFFPFHEITSAPDDIIKQEVTSSSRVCDYRM